MQNQKHAYSILCIFVSVWYLIFYFKTEMSVCEQNFCSVFTYTKLQYPKLDSYYWTDIKMDLSMVTLVSYFVFVNMTCLFHFKFTNKT